MNLRSILAMTALAGLVSLPVVAQQAPASPPTPGVVATTNNPNLAVATVRLENGTRASKIIGATVVADNNDSLGTIDDLVLTGGDKVTVAILAVGGVLGLGAKLVAIPFPQLKLENGKVMLPGMTKDAIAAMPSFVY